MSKRAKTQPFLSPPWIALALALGLLAAVFAACDSGDRTLVEVDPEAVVADPTFEMVQRIIDRSCLPCHGGGGGDDKAGVRILTAAPVEDDRNYSTCFGILDDIDGIIKTGIDNESMPPGAWPRLSEEEKLIITRWLENGACAPCNPCE